jgi:hypothetical protein
MQATRDRQGTYIFVYSPQSDARATLDISSLQRTDRRGWWYDPRTGIATPIEQNLASNRIEVVTPPYGPDWVLVIDDASQGYAPPGLRSVL